MMIEDLFMYFFTEIEEYFPLYAKLLDKILKIYDKMHLLYTTYPETYIRIEKITLEELTKRYNNVGKVFVFKNGGILRCVFNILIFVVKYTQNISIKINTLKCLKLLV